MEDIVRIVFIVLGIIYFILKNRPKKQQKPGPAKTRPKQPRPQQPQGPLGKRQQERQRDQNDEAEPQGGFEEILETLFDDLEQKKKEADPYQQEDVEVLEHEPLTEYTSVDEFELEDFDKKKKEAPDEEKKLEAYFEQQRDKLAKERKADYDHTHDREPAQVQDFDHSVYKAYRSQKKKASRYRKLLKNQSTAQDAFIFSEIFKRKTDF